MKVLIVSFLCAVVVSFALCALSPLGPASATTVLVVASIGAVVLAGGFAAGHFVALRAANPQSLVPRRPFLSVRVGVVFVGALAAEFAVTHLLSAAMPGLALEGVYYLVLFLVGATLALWCKCSGYAPPAIAALVLVVPAVWSFLGFVNSEGASFNYGPERWLFAMQQLTAQTVMLPLDIAVASAAWFVFSRRSASGV